MTRDEMIAKIRAYNPEYKLEELEGSDTQHLEYLLQSLEMHSAIEKRNAERGLSNQSQRRGDEPPELTEEDEEILDRVWARLAEEEKGNAHSN
jgi:hypothetical protein